MAAGPTELASRHRPSCKLEVHKFSLLFTRLFVFVFGCFLYWPLLLFLVFTFCTRGLSCGLLENLQDLFINDFLVGLVLRLIRGWRCS